MRHWWDHRFNSPVWPESCLCLSQWNENIRILGEFYGQFRRCCLRQNKDIAVSDSQFLFSIAVPWTYTPKCWWMGTPAHPVCLCRSSPSSTWTWSICTARFTSVCRLDRIPVSQWVHLIKKIIVCIECVWIEFSLFSCHLCSCVLGGLSAKNSSIF